MHISRLAIRRPVATVMVMLICIVLGLFSLARSPVALMPKITPPIAVVMAVYPGASPQEVASLVTTQLEAAVATTAGLTTISSVSQENVALLMLQFNWGTNMSDVRTDLQERVDRVRMPEGAQRPSLIRFDPNMLPVMQLSAAGGNDLSALKAKLEADVKPRIERVAGVASVFITGAPERQIQVLLDQDKLKEYGLSQSQVSSIIQASNLTMPAGTVTDGDRTLALRVVGQMAAVRDLRSLVVTMAPDLPAGSATPPTGAPVTGAPPTGVAQPMPQIAMKPIYLSDVAEVVEGFGQPTVINRTNGEPSLRMTVQKEGEANTATVATQVTNALEKIRQDYPDLNLVTTMNQGDLIARSISSVALALGGGGLLAVLLLLVFLRNFRPTLIIAVAIPFSVIVTFVLMFVQDLTLNIMTLGGLALGVGMLVDNAIVVIENIYRRLNELREPPQTAAENGAREVAGAITASTLTTVIVFLPIAFVGGMVGELFRELALTVAFSLVASLAVSLTVIPMMASRFLKAQQGIAVPTEPIRPRELKQHPYARALRWALGHRGITLGITAVVLASSIALVPYIGTEFLPVVDEGTFSITVSTPPGTPLAKTAARIDELAAAVANHAPTKLVTTAAGTESGLAGISALASGSGGSNSGNIRVVLQDGAAPTAAVIASLRAHLDLVRGDAQLAYVMDSSLTSAGGAPPNTVQISITGPNAATVRDLVGQIEREMSETPGVIHVTNNLEAAKPLMQVVVDRDAAIRLGLVPAQIAMTVADAINGRVVTRLTTAGQSTDVRILHRAEDRESTAALGNLLITSPMGQRIPLSQVARIEQALGPVSITRENQQISAQVTGMIEGRDVGTVSFDLTARLEKLTVPDGYSVVQAGSSMMMNEGFEGLALALLLAVVLIYMIMAAQFESFLHPFTIMFSMPMAVVGVILALWLTGLSLGITAMIGIVILAGIVVNNAIVLVDFINQNRAQGLALNDAIVEAGRTRIRPIFMTALTTILALVPLAIGIGQGTEIQAPMAVAVIGGLLTSTLLTLVVVPVIYHLFAGRVAALAPMLIAGIEPDGVGGQQQPLQIAAQVAQATQVEIAQELSATQEAQLQNRAGMTNDEFSQLLGLLGKLFSGAARPK